MFNMRYYIRVKHPGINEKENLGEWKEVKISRIMANEFTMAEVKIKHKGPTMTENW